MNRPLTPDELLLARYAEPTAPATPTKTSTVASTNSAAREAYLARLTPLHERLREALAKLPPDDLAQGMHLSTLWPMVRGVQRSKPRAYEVAAALRVLGWSRVRIYSDGTAPSGSFWFPPEVTQVEAKAAVRRKV